MLYPPIISYSAPAFNYKQRIRVYFAISTYNSLGDIAQAQVLVRYQKNNANALDTDKYPNKIKCCSITETTPDQDAAIASTAARYYIEIEPTDLVTGGFEPDTIYKVQLRFSTKSWSAYTSATNLASAASEWSTVCLLKPIEIPTFYIIELGGVDTATTGEEVSITYSNLEPIFTGVYVPVNQSESLRNWRMRLYNESKSSLLADTGFQSANTYESDAGRISFTAQLEYMMSNNLRYHLVFDIETKNGYTESKDYIFTAMSFLSGTLNAQLNLQIDEEDGFAKVNLVGNGDVVHTSVTLRRTSSKSNFVVWEDIANKTFDNATLDWEFNDFTIESGIFYRYAAQSRDNRGRRSSSIMSTIEMGEFDDAFLTESNNEDGKVVQLKIRYDMNISNTAVNVGEAKTDTIGSKYPYVRRNGNMYYHSFPFSFLITTYMDNNHYFATEAEIRDNQVDRYAQAHGAHSLEVYSGRYDYTYERQFREKVEAFLYNMKPKIFRSLTEGNLLIKLMNITLTPKTELGRLLYSVDATAIEIDDATLKNFDKYGIQTIGTYNPNITFDEVKIGQLNRYSRIWSEDGKDLDTAEDYWPAGYNLMGTTGELSSIPNIKSMFHWGQAINDVVVDDFYLSYLKIEVNSPPYMIKNVNNTLTPLDDLPPTEDVPDGETILGTLVNICGTTVVIEYPNTIYEMKGENIHITSSDVIIPLKDTKMTVDFVINLSESIDTSTVATTLIYKTINGQLVGPFNSRTSLYTRIYQRYYLDLYQSKAVEAPYYTKMQTLYNVDIECDPNVVLYVSTNGNTKTSRMLVDETGSLTIDPGQDSGYITELYFYGRNIENRFLKDRGGARPNDPMHLDKYTDSEGVHIYFNGAWYLGTPQDNGTSYDIACQIPALVNYQIQAVKGVY